jgi:hypothetical protein
LFTIILVALGYTLFQSRNLIQGPSITLIEPESPSLISQSLIDVRGQAKNISHITLNGRAIFVDEAGIFHERLLVPQGYTIMTLEAEDRFGRTTTKSIELVRNL